MKQTDWSQWLDQLGSELYASPDAYSRILPQLQDLQQCGKEYRSSYKLNGEHRPKAKDKTIILAAAPMVVIEHGERPQNIIKYIMQRDGTSFIHTAEMLAGYVGMELPKGDYSENQQQVWRDRATKQEMLIDAQQYFVWCLHNADGAEPQREYLRKRFTEADADKMQLGYIPSQAQLFEHLRSKGYDKDTIHRALTSRLNDRIGTTHKITIPIYKAGTICGWIYRHHNQPEAAELKKYQYQSRPEGEPQQNLQFDYMPASLRSNPAIVVVEGQLDALHLGCHLQNVVATGTNSVNPEQVRDAVKRGCKSITLLYDADPTDTDPDTNYNHRCRAIGTILDTLQGMGKADEVRLYVADLPQPDPAKKVDPDSYLNNAGAAAVDVLVRGAGKSWEYQLLHVSKPYDGKSFESQKQLDEYRDKLLELYCTITDPLDRQLYRNAIGGFLSGVDGSTLDKMMQEYATKQAKQRNQQQAADLMRQAAALMQQGDTARAIELQNKATQLATEAEAAEEYTRWLEPVTEERIIAELEAMPDAVHTGLYLGTAKRNETDKDREDREILLPAGGITILAAPTSHGKTTMLVSMAVHAAKANPSKRYYLLSYEEQLAAVTIKALSCWAGLELSSGNKRTIETYLKSGKWYGYPDRPELLAGFNEQKQQYFDAIKSKRLSINYTESCCESLCRNIRKLAEAGNVGAVFVDYVQYIELANVQGTYSRQEQIGKICRQLKDVAVETGIPLVLGAQFNREVCDPTTLALSNIGEGGEIERKAANVVGFWNNDMPTASSRSHTPNMGEIAKLTHGHVYDCERPNKNKSIYAVVLKNRSGIGAKAGTGGLLSFNGNIGTIGTYQQKDLQDNLAGKDALE